MKSRLLLCLALFFSLMSYGQEINLDTEVTGNLSGDPLPNGTIEEYWYWAHGIDVTTGTGFAPNSPITVFAIDPTGYQWRNFTTTSDAQGAFTVGKVTAKKISSVLGSHIITAQDGQGNSATAILTVIANRRETVIASVDRNELTVSELINEGVWIKASNMAPETEVVIHITAPYSGMAQLELDETLYSDINGEIEVNVNGSNTTWGAFFPDTPGKWSFNVDVRSSGEPYAKLDVRVWPDNPSTDDYCTIEQSNSTVHPITHFEIVNSNSNTSSVSSVDYYEDFTDMIFDVNAGSSYLVKIKGKNGYSTTYDTYTLFVDWNQNGVLDEENEALNEVIQEGYIFGSTGEDDIFTEFEIKIPDNALSGNTRLRLLKVASTVSHTFYWPTGACGYYNSKGQVEDYTINVIGGIDVLPDCEFTSVEDITVTAENDNDFAVVDYDLNFSCEAVEGFSCELNYGSGLEQGLGNSGLYLVANDFDLPEGTTSKITKVKANIATYYSQTNVYFYEDNDGEPGDLITSFATIDHSSTQTSIGTLFSVAAYAVEIELPEPVELSGGKYWLALNTSGPLAYLATSSNVINEVAYRGTSSGQWIEQEGHEGVISIEYECDGSGDTEMVLVNGLESGAEFPVGTTNVKYNLVYKGHVIDNSAFKVIVNPTAPTDCAIACPEDIFVQVESTAVSAPIEYSIDYQCVAGAAQAELKQVGGLASGADFPVGRTTVTYNLVYGDEILDECSFDVLVERCAIVCPENITVQVQQGVTSTPVNYDISYECENGSNQSVLKLISGLISGSDFPVGTMTVVYHLLYNNNVVDRCSFDVTVETEEGINGLNESRLNVYPNPVTDILHLDGEQEIAQVLIYDLMGRKVLEQKVNAKEALLNMSALSGGAYIVKIQTNDSVKSVIIHKQNQ